MGVLWELHGNIFSPLVGESRWLQTWRFWVPFCVWYLMLCWQSFLASSRRPIEKPVFIYCWFPAFQTGLQMSLIFCQKCLPPGLFVLNVSVMCFIFCWFGDLLGDTFECVCRSPILRTGVAWVIKALHFETVFTSTSNILWVGFWGPEWWSTVNTNRRL